MNATRRRITALVAGALAAILVTGSAAAARPTIETSVLTFSDHVDCADLGDFDFSFDVSLAGRQVVQDFGERLSVHTTLTGSVEASNGTTLRVHHAWTDDWNFANGTLTVTGLAFGTRVDGTSVMRLDRGRLVIDLSTGEPTFMAGKWLPFFGPDLATCELIEAAAT